MIDRALADLVVAVHLAFIAFVVLGGLWARGRRWRTVTHLLAAAWGFAAEAIPGVVCPLTPLENQLAARAGEAGYQGSFIEHYLVPILYPAWLTRPTQWALAGRARPVHVLLAGGGALGRTGFRDHGGEPGIGGAMADLELYAALARQLRADSIRCSTAAGSGHPTSSLSAADLMAVLLAGHLRYDWSQPKNLANDHLIFSKGHASPLYYALLRAAGAREVMPLVVHRLP